LDALENEVNQIIKPANGGAYENNGDEESDWDDDYGL